MQHHRHRLGKKFKIFHENIYRRSSKQKQNVTKRKEIDERRIKCRMNKNKCRM
jgi:hypothetical protein